MGRAVMKIFTDADVGLIRRAVGNEIERAHGRRIECLSRADCSSADAQGDLERQQAEHWREYADALLAVAVKLAP
ncbi:hypothetical protein [Rhizobium phage RHph_X2_26]|nr:hypothetical protein [Rhizobium phage RHph_X2_26]